MSFRITRSDGAEQMVDTIQYDYTNQAWLKDGVYRPCAHPTSMNCKCFGKIHMGEPAIEGAEVR